MHNHLGLPNEEEKSGLSLIATLLAGKPKMLWTYNIYIINNNYIYVKISVGNKQQIY